MQLTVLVFQTTVIYRLSSKRLLREYCYTLFRYIIKSYDHHYVPYNMRIYSYTRHDSTLKTFSSYVTTTLINIDGRVLFVRTRVYNRVCRAILVMRTCSVLAIRENERMCVLFLLEIVCKVVTLFYTFLKCLNNVFILSILIEYGGFLIFKIANYKPSIAYYKRDCIFLIIIIFVSNQRFIYITNYLEYINGIYF